MNFIEEWLSHFAGDIPNKFLKKRVFNGGFIWHIYSATNLIYTEVVLLICKNV